ncbi:MAG: hypothetical protein ACLRL6_04735 [Clostridium sp.]
MESRNKGVEIYLSRMESPFFLNMPFVRLEEEIQEEELITVSRGLIVNLSFIANLP